MKWGLPLLVVALSLCGLTPPLAQAQQLPRNFRGNFRVAPGGVPMPYMQNDAAGNQWMIYPGGWVRQGGAQPVLGQGDMLNINGVPSANGNPVSCKLDQKTGELVFDNLAWGDISVTRRILISKTDTGVRFIDIFKNNSNQEQSANINYQSSTNFGVNSGTVVNDPHHPDNAIGWVARTAINQSPCEVFGGVGNVHAVPTVSDQPNTNMVQAVYDLKIAAGKSVALMHLITIRPGPESGQEFIQKLNAQRVLKSVPSDVRKLIVNFASDLQQIGDYEILRGDSLDVVELRGGDQIKGTIKEDSFKLETFFGPVELTPPHVVAILNVGQFRPRQLLVTADGQVFGGKLNKDTLSIELSSGQVTQVPLAQISRVGYRRQPNEPDEWNFDGPMVFMRSGERVKVQMPAGPLQVNTRYGVLKLDPGTVNSIAFQSDDSPVHEITLTDGSKFSGLVDGDEFEMTLIDGAAAPVKFPVNRLLKLQISGKSTDTDDSRPNLTLSTSELMIGSLTGQLKLDTSFDTLQINAPEVRRIARTSPQNSDVQITLWDNTTVSGQLEDPLVQCHLLSGTDISLPVSMILVYNQPLPLPSATVIEKIKDDIKQLSADDFKVREQSEADLVAIGQPVIAVLKDERAAQPPEAQARIDSIIKQLTGGDSAAPKPPEPQEIKD